MVNSIHIILKAYDVVPHSISAITDRVYKVSDGNRWYAVKKSRMTRTTVLKWQHVYDMAYAHNLKNILPVYLTVSGHLFYELGNVIYYMSPWIEDHQAEQQDTIFNLYEMFGRLHETTRRTADVEHEVTKGSFAEYEKMLNNTYDRYLSYIDRFEQQHFMSPFELQACTHFVHIDHVFNTLYDRLRTFTTQLTTDPAQTVSLCHGQMKPEHYIYHHEGFFINWEEANFGHPMQDVAILLQTVSIVHRLDESTWLNGLEYYFSVYQETQNDRLLLTLYLLDPLPYIELLDRYLTYPKSESMLMMTRNLEQELRKYQFALKVTEQVNHSNDFQVDSD